MKKAIILGGGISGLTCSYYLHQKYPQIETILLEKKNRLGGWIETKQEDGFLFECGPRGFRGAGKGQNTLKLLQDIGVKHQLITHHSSAKKKFIFTGKIECLGLKFLLKHNCFFVLFKSLFSFPLKKDVSIAYFFTKYFGKKFTQTIVDPVVRGIFAGDSQHLSMQACFPKLYEMACQTYVLLPHLIKQKSQNKDPHLYSFKHGMEQFIESFALNCKSKIYLETTVNQIDPKGIVVTNHGAFEGDLILSTLPTVVLKKVFLDLPKKYESLIYQTVHLVHIGFNGGILNQNQGFGYLVPLSKDPTFLGMTWDSDIFPQQQNSSQVRMTLFFNQESSIQQVQSILKNHLGIEKKPDHFAKMIKKEAIPQYPIGYMEKKVPRSFGKIRLIGSAFEGVGINDCITLARDTVKRL